MDRILLWPCITFTHLMADLDVTSLDRQMQTGHHIPVTMNIRITCISHMSSPTEIVYFSFEFNLLAIKSSAISLEFERKVERNVGISIANQWTTIERLI